MLQLLVDPQAIFLVVLFSSLFVLRIPLPDLGMRAGLTNAMPPSSYACVIRGIGVVVRTMRFGVSTISGTSFSRLVGHVGKMVAEEQVVWADTSRVVALMQHIQSGWDRATDELPHNPMGENAPTRVSSTDVAVPVAVTRGRPFPTTMWSII